MTTGGGDDHDEFDALDLEFAALLADPGMWATPSAALSDRVVAAVRSEALLADPAVGGVHAAAGRQGSVRRRAWLRPALLGAAAAIVFLFGGIVVLSALSGADDVDTFSAELVSTGVIPDVGGTIGVTSFESGLRIDLRASGLPRRDNGEFYEGWVRTVDGNLFPVGTFHDGADVILWAGVELDRVELFTVTLESAAGPVDPGQGSSGEVVLRTEIRP